MGEFTDIYDIWYIIICHLNVLLIYFQFANFRKSRDIYFKKNVTAAGKV